jgi:4-amino-4-deoxy-L-arabinose transferase-like glycosyltransferase
MNTPTTRPSRWVTLDLATLALVVRLAVVVYALAEPVWDGHYYDVGARRIAAGFGYSEDLVIAGPGGIERIVWDPWAHYPVGYSGFIALFLKVFGGGLAVAPLANALTGGALVAVVHRLSLHVFRSDRRALVAALLVALHPGLVLYSGALMTEPLAALGMLAAVLAVVADRNAWRGAAIAAVLLGLTTLVRPNALLLAPFLPFLAPKSPRPSTWTSRLTKLVARGAVVGTLTLATVMPWTLRN